MIQIIAEKREAISLILLYHFHPLHKHLGNIRAITADSSPLHKYTTLAAGVELETFGFQSLVLEQLIDLLIFFSTPFI